MIRPIGYLILFPVIIISCSSGNKGETSDINVAYELIQMQNQGVVDSSIMDQALSSGDNEIIEAAAKTCGIVRDRRFTARLTLLCKRSEKKIREAAIFALGEIKDTTSINGLAEVLHIEDFDTRILAIEALGKIGNRTAAPFVRPPLQKSDEEAYEAALALWRMADSSSLTYMRDLAARSTGETLYGAVYALFRIAPDSAVAEFERILKNRPVGDSLYAETAAIAARGLGAANDTVVIADIFESHFGTLDRPTQIELIRALGSVGAGREKLERVLENSDDNGVKRVSLLSLGQIGSVKSRTVVEKYLRDSSLQVRLAAISVIPDVNRRSPTNTLIKFKSSDNWHMRAEAVRSLGKVGSRRSLNNLRLMLEDNDDRVKAAVIEGLGEFPVRRNIDIVKAALNGSKDKVVKSVAADVLGSSGHLDALEILIESAGKNIDTDQIDFARSLIEAIAKFIDSTEAGIMASETVAEFLNHHNRIVREEAYAALGSMAPEEFDPGVFATDFGEEDFEELQNLRELDVVAIIETERGDISLKLEPGMAPRTVANFVKLAERGFYDDLSFHRVVQNFVIQSGCPREDGWGGPGYTIREEINPLRFKRGTIGMATSGRNTGGSQFFICLSGQPHLNGRYTSFGNVIEGWDVLDKIEIGDKVISVKVEKGRF